MIIPLAFAECNKYHTIKSIQGNSCAKSALTEKGFCCGNKVCLVRNMNGNFVVKIGNSQYIIGFGFAKDIMVEE